MSKIEEIKVSSKGQLVIPKDMREDLGLKPGSKVLLSRHDHAVLLVPKPSDPVRAIIELGNQMKLGDMKEEVKKHRRIGR
ncbi:MAG: AbrB/MazE/SpoVT family DNA-binding domain-containing protein [Candidatus Aenigmarchaeota archaeon]|nr:AbrB/MazE/SpoVT family DNA-binding domain-containing protein [Candidatus Aenigmarchaeota archaeon]